MSIRIVLPEWREPLSLLPALQKAGHRYALLYSGMQTEYSGRFSLLGWMPKETLTGKTLADFAIQLTIEKETLENTWIGYVTYEQAVHMVHYHVVLLFDHELKNIICQSSVEYGDSWRYLWQDVSIFEEDIPLEIMNVHSNMTKPEYLQKVGKIQEAILAGTVYQANLTRKFIGEFKHAPAPEQLFLRLVEASPATYSAIIKTGTKIILSSSPEQFLKMDAEGKVETRPIKGSAPLEISAAELQNSEKNRAENLMIVDLMRNDLSHSCKIGSVKVEDLFKVSTYATLHHMASTVTGIRAEENTPLDLVAACLPPGSMTGAPKLKAIEICHELEQAPRGIYSGVLGWFGGDGSCDLSVIIRTLILEENRFEFQVGGGIVSDSTPENEWEETLTKSKGIAKAIGLDLEVLSKI